MARFKSCVRCGNLIPVTERCGCMPARKGSTRKWREQRARVLERDGFRCTALVGGERCGATSNLHVDHIVA